MHAVLLDFNGTMFFDTRFHMEAWSEIYHELHPEDPNPLDPKLICGPCNESIIQNMAPWLNADERKQCSERKEELYRRMCRRNPDSLHLVAGAEKLMQGLHERGIPFILASASIKANVDFYFDSFPIGKWLKKEDVVYDDGTYADKGEFAVVLGPSGAGKSTILNVLGGMDTCTTGEITVDGKRIDKYNSRQLTAYRRYDIT